MNIYKNPLCFQHSSLWLQNELTEEYDIRLFQQMNQDLALLNSLVLDAMQEITLCRWPMRQTAIAGLLQLPILQWMAMDFSLNRNCGLWLFNPPSQKQLIVLSDLHKLIVQKFPMIPLTISDVQLPPFLVAIPRSFRSPTMMCVLFSASVSAKICFMISLYPGMIIISPSTLA